MNNLLDILNKSVNYLEKKKIENVYRALGYDKTSSLLKRKISRDLKNDAYIEAVMKILKGVE